MNTVNKRNDNYTVLEAERIYLALLMFVEPKISAYSLVNPP